MLEASGLVSPDRRELCGNRSDRERPEIAAIKTVRRARVHQKDFTLTEQAAALPARQRTTQSVALPCLSTRFAPDEDRRPFATDIGTWQREHVFDQRNTARKVFALSQKAAEFLGRHNGNQVTDLQAANGLRKIEPHIDHRSALRHS